MRDIDILIADPQWIKSRGTGETVYGILSIAQAQGWSVEIIDDVPLSKLMTEYNPKLVIIGPRYTMRTASQTAREYPDSHFIMMSYTNIGVWDRYGEIPQIQPWINACQELPNCYFGANNKRIYESLSHLQNVVYLPNTHTSVLFPPRPLRDGTLNLAYGGRLDFVKGIPSIALAVAQIRRDRDVKFHVWGQCKESLYDDHYGRWFGIISDIIEIHDYTDGHEAFRNELARHHIDVFVSPSYSESYCYSAADALTAGLPVVGTPSIDFLPQYWQITDPGSATLVARKITELADLNEDQILEAQKQFLEDNQKRINACTKTLRRII